MQMMERKTVEQVLLSLNEGGFLFSQFEFVIQEDGLAFLGAGGFSAVYEMQNRRRKDSRYALKVTGFEKHTQTSLDFWNMARIQGILCETCPYIVRTIQAVEILADLSDDGSPENIRVYETVCEEIWEKDREAGIHLQAVLMEKLEPVVCKDRFHHTKLQDERFAKENEVLRFALQIGQALLLSHEHTVLHRDIKLENIFWDKEANTYKLGDFGAARYTAGEQAETVVYTDGYGAPEIERHLHDSYGMTADIYSLGITLYLLLNDLKFPGSDGYYSRTVLQYDPEFVLPAPAHASPEVARILRKMCSFYPEDRYQHMGEVLSDLAETGKTIGVSEAERVRILADEATETYREMQPEQDDLRSEERPVKKKSRAFRKKVQKELRYYYVMYSALYLIALTAVLLFFQASTISSDQWEADLYLRMLPIGLLFEAFLQRNGHLRYFWGAILLGITAVSAVNLGFTLLHLLVIAGILFGEAVISFAISLSMIMMMLMGGKIAGGSFLYMHDLGWILFALTLLLCIRYFEVGIEWEQTPERRAFMGGVVVGWMFPVMILTGIILFALQTASVLSLPDFVRHMHPAWTGGAGFFIMLLRTRRDGFGMEDTES